MRTGLKNLTRAERKKARKQYHVGDPVTWDSGSVAHRVVEVNARGVVVDVTSCVAWDPHVSAWARPAPGGRWHLLVLYDRNAQGPGPRCRFRERGVCAGPVRHSSLTPDVAPRAKYGGTR